FISTGAVAFLLVAVFAMAFAMMSSAFSASLCAIRYDILPALWPELRSDAGSPAQQAAAQQRSVVAGVAFYLLMLIAFGLVAGLGGSRLVVAFYCAQLAPVPLILGPVIARARGGYGIVSSGWALAIVAASAAIGIGAVAVHLATGIEPWLWVAVPATLGSGFLLFAIARFWPAPNA
ncbi:MAG: hypothetical protein JO134_20965, partial [Xanthobacteraceae bacterium]|nr:hypothetical protein [Xanthobacteraceae bacterium]